MAGQPRRASRIGARVAIVTSIVGLAFGLGAAPAFADPGNGNGNPNPPGHSDPPGNGNGAATAHATNGNAGTFGSPTSPQPIQHPDNQNGANAHPGPYSSTRDGSPSLNGNGNGQAVGKPCAGCVGKADNKNPAGQFPNGSDHNAGYECDRNNGIGQTNPAHTGCAESPPVPETPPVPVTPPNEVVPPAPVTPPNEVVPPAKGITPPGALTTAIPLPGVSISGVSIPSVSIPSVSVPARALPVTGSAVLLELLLGLAALVVGGAMTVVSRRRRLLRA